MAKANVPSRAVSGPRHPLNAKHMVYRPLSPVVDDPGLRGGLRRSAGAS